jgi:hypothetical protein
MKQFERVDAVGLLAEMGLEKMVVDGLEHKGVVDGDVSHPLYTEPAGLSATSEGLVHDVIGDEEEGLKLLKCWCWIIEGKGLKSQNGTRLKVVEGKFSTTS